VVDYRKRIQDLKVQLEMGRIQVGVDDADFKREEALRNEHASLIERERQILRSLDARPNEGVELAFRNASTMKSAIAEHDARIDAIVTQRVAEMRKVLDEESAKLTGYRARVTELEGESEEVVGGIALDNFRKVRQRFYDLVLRADVGIIDVSWAVREEHRTRAEVLTRERARSLKALEDEYRDIMDQQPEAER
jgi:hypothetical protein